MRDKLHLCVPQTSGLHCCHHRKLMVEDAGHIRFIDCGYLHFFMILFDVR